MTKNAVTDNATGAVLKFGFTDFVYDHNPSTQTVYQINETSVPPTGVPAYYCKLSSSSPYYNMVEMTAAEKKVVDDAWIAPLSESSDISNFLNTNARVVDSYSGITGSYMVMELLNHRKDLYNDPDNPIYEPGFTPLLGDEGSVEELTARVANLENIHAKNGWHNQQVIQSLYEGPEELLIYYGWPSSFNYPTNAWTNEKVAQDMAKYDLIVLGDGIQSSSHGDYSNTTVIIPRIKALNPSTKIFGYVTVNQASGSFETKADQWNMLGVHGIFMDEAGYDYGKTRDEFNDLVDYVHNLTTSSICFANAWNMDHIIGTTNDPSYPNSTYNSGAVESNLTNTDWYLLESYPINTTAYSVSGGYESKGDWAVRGVKAIGHRYNYGINLAAVGIINNDNVNGDKLFNFGYVSSLMFSLEAFGTSDTSYAAGSAIITHWERQDLHRLNKVWSLSPSVQLDAGDSDVYWRYVQFGRFMLDFSPSTQSSAVIYDSLRFPNSDKNPSTLLPRDGDRYYNTDLQMEMQYDGSRSKWLSMDACTFNMGRNGATAAGSYYNGIDGLTYSATRGYVCFHSGTVVAFGYTRDDTDATTFEVTSNGNAVTELTSSAISGHSNALNGDFNEGDILAVRNKSGGNTTSYVATWVKVKWKI